MYISSSIRLYRYRPQHHNTDINIDIYHHHNIVVCILGLDFVAAKLPLLHPVRPPILLPRGISQHWQIDTETYITIIDTDTNTIINISTLTLISNYRYRYWHKYHNTDIDIDAYKNIDSLPSWWSRSCFGRDAPPAPRRSVGGSRIPDAPCPIS